MEKKDVIELWRRILNEEHYERCMNSDSSCDNNARQVPILGGRYRLDQCCICGEAKEGEARVKAQLWN
jgi:hypothetical protein